MITFDVTKRDGSHPNLVKIALEEEWAKGLVYSNIEGFAITKDGKLILLDQNGNYAVCPPDRFIIH